MSKQLSLFPELEWEEYEYQGKIYKRKNYNSISYRQKQEIIIKTLELQEPKFEKTAEWGHFGNEFTWG